MDLKLLTGHFAYIFVAKKNIVVPHCKLHNDGSIDVSQDGTLLATYVPSTQGFPDNGQICVFSLRKESFGQCIYARSYGMLVLLYLSLVVFFKFDFTKGLHRIFVAVSFLFSPSSQVSPPLQ